MSAAASPMEAVPRLIIPAGPRFAGVGAEFVRGTALAGGIEVPLAERLALIAEEVLGTTADAAGPVGLAVQDRRHAVRLLVEIARADEVNLAGLDQSHATDLEDFEQVGLYLAARLAERLTTALTGKG
ncbi:hypothetical protein, partial [Aphanothece microscopica]|uniref:hypothetical protein n=1 Tax=Aphanothece microscopica TaxID=1049561 RepID=UPI003CE4B718